MHPHTIILLPGFVLAPRRCAVFVASTPTITIDGPPFHQHHIAMTPTPTAAARRRLTRRGDAVQCAAAT